MALTGDYYAFQYKGHTVELIRNNGSKALSLRIDGTEVANESCLLPGRLTLKGGPEHNELRHAVVARSSRHGLVSSRNIIEADGSVAPLR